MVEKAALYKLSASFLKVPQAMRAAGFSDEDESNVAKQMHVSWALARLTQQQTNALPVGRTVSVPSCSPTTTINSTSSLSATTAAHSFMEEFLSDEMIPSPPGLDEV